MTSTSADAYTAVAAQTREATEKSVEAFRNGAKTLTDQFSQFSFPTIDLTEPVARYFEYVQQAVDFNRDLLTKWAELVTSVSGSLQEQAEKVTEIVKEQANTVADLSVKQAEKAEQVAKDQAKKVEQTERDHAREPYQGLTKVQLSEQLAERGLPKTGTVDELIDRLVSADSE